MPQAAHPTRRGRRPDPPTNGRGGGTIGRRHRRPKGPKVSVLASMQFHLHSTLRSASWRLSSSACTMPALLLLERKASYPERPMLLSHATAGRNKLTARQIAAQLRHAKAAERPHACAPPSSWPSPTCRQSLAWQENVDGQARPHLPQAHLSATFFSSIIGQAGHPWTKSSITGSQ